MYDNCVYLTGHVVRDPELKFLNDGKGVTKFTLAVNRSYSDETDFINIEVWNRGNYKLAEYVGNDVRKGDQVTVRGELRIDKYNDKYYTKVVAEKVIYAKKKKQDKPGDDYDIDDAFNIDVPF